MKHLQSRKALKDLYRNVHLLAANCPWLAVLLPPPSPLPGESNAFAPTWNDWTIFLMNPPSSQVHRRGWSHPQATLMLFVTLPFSPFFLAVFRRKLHFSRAHSCPKDTRTRHIPLHISTFQNNSPRSKCWQGDIVSALICWDFFSNKLKPSNFSAVDVTLELMRSTQGRLLTEKCPNSQQLSIYLCGSALLQGLLSIEYKTPKFAQTLSNSLARRLGRRSCRYFSFLSLFPHDFSRAGLLPWVRGYTDHPINSPGGLIGEYERPLLSVTFPSGYLSLRAHISISSCLPLYWHLPLAPSLLPHRLFSMAPAWGWPGCAMTWESHPASENGRISAFPQQAVLQVPSPPQK